MPALSCFAQSDTLPTFAELGAKRQPWDCSGQKVSTASEHTFTRFELSKQTIPPRYLVARIGHFEKLTVGLQSASGEWREQSYSMEQALPTSIGPFFKIALPKIDSGDRQMIVRFDKLNHTPTLELARLSSFDPDYDAPHQRGLLLVAILLGMMLVPILFDVTFWHALRKKFVLWHMALSASFSTLIALRSGLINQFVPLDLTSWRAALVMAFGVSIAVGLMFTRSFVERGLLNPTLKRLIPCAAAWTILASVIHALALEPLRPLGGLFHSYAMLPVVLLYIAVTVNALARGSRAMRFQLIGWGPLLAVCLLQIASNVSPVMVPTDALQFFYLAVLSEAIATAIGVADRFFYLRRERDEAITEMKLLEQLSERDPLTGLMNRRALDERFRDLHRAGYETVAVFDLDNFKRVNDTVGHAVGDEVLQVCARVLSDESDSIAIRMGGEEFLLLMRGEDTLQRAEALRQSLPVRVAAEMEGLPQMVTASMGLVVMPRSAAPNANFADIYRRADKLLYEAKEQGRNRGVVERMMVFARRKSDPQPAGTRALGRLRRRRA